MEIDRILIDQYMYLFYLIDAQWIESESGMSLLDIICFGFWVA